MKFNRKLLITLAIAITLLSLTLTSNSHVPINAEGNIGLDSAQEVTNPTKSWAIYSTLDEADSVAYFKFTMAEGETIFVSLFVTTRADEVSFVPEFALMGPGIDTTGSVPAYVQTVGNAMVVTGERSDPSYESFGPSHLVNIADIRIPAPASGEYFLAIYSQTGPGHYGVAIGVNESFTLLETVSNPINVINVYLWQGESLFFVFIPYLLTFAVGIYVFRNRMSEATQVQWGLYLLSLLYLSSSVAFTWQTIYNVYMSHLGPEIIISLFIIGMQASIGSGIMSLAKRDILTDRSAQIRLIILSLLSLILWVGVVIGPVIGLLFGSLVLLRSFIS